MDILEQEMGDPYGDFEKQDYDDEVSQQQDSQASEQSKSQGASSQQQQQAALMGGGGYGGKPRITKKQLNDLKQIKATQIAAKAMERALADKEKELDDKISSLHKMGKEEMEELREKRLEQLKQKKEQRDKWIANDHGRLIDIRDQKDFFQLVKTSKYVITMFYSKQSKWCKELREHITLLARQHLECKFTQIDAETCPFLLEKLNIWMMPTLVLAKQNKVDRQLVGLDWCAPDGKIDTTVLEQKLFEFGFLEETYLAINKQLKQIQKEKAQEDASDDDLDL